jgi:hypothetical protein
MGQPLDETGKANAGNGNQRATDIGNASTEDLVGFIGHLASNAKTVQVVAGRLIAEVLGRGAMTIRDLESETGVPRSTLDRWAAPYKTVGAHQ